MTRGLGALSRPEQDIHARKDRVLVSILDFFDCSARVKGLHDIADGRLINAGKRITLNAHPSRSSGAGIVIAVCEWLYDRLGHVLGVVDLFEAIARLQLLGVADTEMPRAILDQFDMVDSVVA